MSGSLDDLVTAVSAALMAATAGNAAAISQQVRGDLGVDFGFLRHNDHAIRATVLVANWPPLADPDAIGVVYFDEADSVFALTENYKDPYVLRPEPANADYQRNIEEGTGIASVSLACIPLLS